MNELRLDPFVRALIADTAAATREFSVGQQWTGRVVQALAEDRFVVTLGGLRLLAQSELPLAPGQRIAVEVTSTGGPIELRLRPANSANGVEGTIRLVPPSDVTAQETLHVEQPVVAEVSEKNYQVAALLNALVASEAEGSRDRDSVARAAAALRKSVFALLPADEADALQRILQPLALGARSSDIARALHAWLRDGGFLFESHVRALLTASSNASADEVLAALRDDLKQLLGRLVLRCARRVPAVADRARGTVPDLEEEFVRAGGACADTVAEALLADQVEVAYRWVSEGVLSFEVPVGLPRGEARALVRLKRDAANEEAREGGERREPAWSVSLHVESEDFGAVHAMAHWRPGECEAMFFVDRPGARDALAAHVGSLESGLGTVFDRVKVGVSLDEVRARRPASGLRPEEPPGGSIVNLRI